MNRREHILSWHLSGLKEGKCEKEKTLTSLASGVKQRELISCSLEMVYGVHSRLWTSANLGSSPPPLLILLSVELLMDQMTNGIWWLLKLLQIPPFPLSLPSRGWLLRSPAPISHCQEMGSPPSSPPACHCSHFLVNDNVLCVFAVYPKLLGWWCVVPN